MVIFFICAVDFNSVAWAAPCTRCVNRQPRLRAQRPQGQLRISFGSHTRHGQRISLEHPFKGVSPTSHPSCFVQAIKPPGGLSRPKANSPSPSHRLFQHLKNPRCLALRHVEAHKWRSRLAQAEHVAGGEDDTFVQGFLRYLGGVQSVR